MSTSLAWFRRDARLIDNPAWIEASHSDVVCPLFVIDPRIYNAVTATRRDLLIGGLVQLDRSLSALGGRLRVEEGDPRVIVPEVAAEFGATVVHVNREVTPYGRHRDADVARNVRLEESDGVYLHRPGSVVSAEGKPYRVFSAFFRKWSDREVVPIPDAGGATPTDDPGIGLPHVSQNLGIEAGEEAGLRRLSEFTQRVDRYHQERDLPALDSTSRLSVDLKYGWIGPRTVLDAVGAGSPGRDAFVRQLAWRDFHAGLMLANPEIVDVEMQSRYRDMEWRDDPLQFAAWKEGRTGYPLVDAGMRQLSSEGWMHNRVRMITASFLVKDLLIDWRDGEKHFRRLLIDGDVSQNVGNWQWVAGTGTDAAPYFRVFNPVTQSKRFDPEGEYIRRWVSELSGLPAPLIHEPWKFGPLELAAHGVVLGDTYPEPIVDHSMARERALVAYRTAASP